jgi:hypothetical protein
MARTGGLPAAIVLTCTLTGVSAAPAWADPQPGGLAGAAGREPVRPPAAVEVTAGYAGFADDGTIGHSMFGAALRVPVTPRISVGPEVQFMQGPGSDRDLILTGNLTFDVLRPRPPGAGVATPFLVIGAGLYHHSDSFNGQTYGSTEGSVTGGGGVRVWLSKRVYTTAELRFGWELHYRVTGTVGIALPD